MFFLTTSVFCEKRPGCRELAEKSRELGEILVSFEFS